MFLTDRHQTSSVIKDDVKVGFPNVCVCVCVCVYFKKIKGLGNPFVVEEEEEVTSHSVCLLQVWSHKEYPLIPVGKLVLNRNPTNYFAEVEQLAFDPSNMPPGVEPSPDKMLQVNHPDVSHTHASRTTLAGGGGFDSPPKATGFNPQCPQPNLQVSHLSVQP